MSDDQGEPMLAAAIGAAGLITGIIILGATYIVCGAIFGIAYASWWGYTTYRNKKQEEQFPALKFVHQKLKEKNMDADSKENWKEAKKRVLKGAPIIIYNQEDPDDEFFAFGTPEELAQKRANIRQEFEKKKTEHIFLKQ